MKYTRETKMDIKTADELAAIALKVINERKVKELKRISFDANEAALQGRFWVGVDEHTVEQLKDFDWMSEVEAKGFIVMTIDEYLATLDGDNDRPFINGAMRPPKFIISWGQK